MISLLLLLACTNAQDTDVVDSSAPAPELGEPITADANTWTWVDFPDSACDDGSATGIGVNPGTSSNVLFFFNGGGACWDYETCFVAHTASQGPFGKSELKDTVRYLTGSILDRDDKDNPFADWSYVFVPYCTGDLHGGDHVVTYANSTDSADYHHVGHSNVLAYLKRLGATWPTPDQLVVSGASAGGGGALLNYRDVRRYWPDTKMALLDDSLPLFEGDDIQPWLRTTWATEWDLTPLMEQACPDCAGDFSLWHKTLRTMYPDDRMALLSSEQDGTISGYYLLSAEHFQEDLLKMDADVLEPSGWHTFFITGKSHTMVGSPAKFSSNGQALWPWLTQMVNDDPAWASVAP